jgi:hypothetical protein
VGESSRLPPALFLLGNQAGTCQTQEAAVNHLSISPNPLQSRVWVSCSFNSLVEPDIPHTLLLPKSVPKGEVVGKDQGHSTRAFPFRALAC